ncbi:hypothetical protein CANARDRAFT_28997 [[Candida] arabinofermentans NRRL YB-2248]|uniref:Arrestin C-terminal-like domain-containing protein n=1 Tax=[Candida] arabinofermentans NRRL YB-2248 TaxID=983967 RepID=A0A1E4SY81_9ASCO|nr:hypothetical protein CANARDRAFT_28997 [[Candida] arabinofermentans NRRL YB-2248]
MDGFMTSPLFPVEELSTETAIKLPPHPNAESDSVKLYIILAEPNIFLEGFSPEEIKSRPPSILRGCLFIRILKPVKIKNISLKLSGTSRTDWPEGIPPKKVDHSEVNTFLQHTWPFFNYTNTYSSTETSRNNADLYISATDSEHELPSLSLDSTLSPVTSPIMSDLNPIKSPSSLVTAFKSSKRLVATATKPSLLTQLSDLDVVSTKSNSASTPDENKHFAPGDYIYSFEQPIQASFPETTSVTFGSVFYVLEASLERSGTFKSNLNARRKINIVRTSSQDSIEENEPIVITRDWEDQLKYEIVISSKQILLNSYLPLAFRLTPMDKIKIQRLRVYLTEHLEYYCRNKKVHRTEPSKKYLLMEHKPPDGCDNLLAIDGDAISAKEFEFQVYVPERIGERYKLHPDTSFEDIQSHHWIKLCIRISKPNPTPADPQKRKHFELSIDSPVHILSPQCAHANTLLPAYVGSSFMEQQHESNEEPLIDILMSPTNGMNLSSNMYKPDDDIPIELKSPQAKPFSPMASPELHAMSPKLRTPVSSVPLGGPASSSSTSIAASIVRPGLLLSQSGPVPPPFEFDTPPPNFAQTQADVPPSYDDVIRDDTESEEAGTSASDASSSIRMGVHSDASSLKAPIPLSNVAATLVKFDENRSRSGRERERQRGYTRSTNNSGNTEDDDDNDGDLGGNFKLKVIPIRSRSTSRDRSSSPSYRAVSPALNSQYSSRSRLINSTVLPGYAQQEHSSNALDSTIAEALRDENEGDEGDDSSVTADSLNDDDEEDVAVHDYSPNNRNEKLTAPDSPDRRSSFSSINSATASLISDDPLARAPLLQRDSLNITRNSSIVDQSSHPLYYGSNNNSYVFRTNSAVGADSMLFSNREREGSVDITSLLSGDPSNGSSNGNGRSEEIWHPFNMASSHNLNNNTGRFYTPRTRGIGGATDQHHYYHLHNSTTAASHDDQSKQHQPHQHLPSSSSSSGTSPVNKTNKRFNGRHLSFGVGPVLAALNGPSADAEADASDNVTTTHVSAGVKGDYYDEPVIPDTVNESAIQD